jgi:hypothetical protein
MAIEAIIVLQECRHGYMAILIIFFIHDVNTCLADANARPSGGLHRCRLLVLFPTPLKPVARDLMTRSWAEHGAMDISAVSISLGRPVGCGVNAGR